MNPRIKIAGIVLFVLALHGSTVLAAHSGLSGLSPAFLRDYDVAQKMVDEMKSAEPLLGLVQRYTNVAEKAELEVSIGLVYGQRTGVVDPAKAVAHFTAALKYELPEKTCLQILLWRGNSHEQLKQTRDALHDYLRGLLACSYHDLSGGWPTILDPKIPIYVGGPPDPENAERARDYNRYRKAIDFQQFLLQQRYFLIDAVKRLTKKQSDSDAQMVEILEKLSPDSSRHGIILDWLKSENKRPWP
jgi:hypothetical protein